jgi:hypothetical protein
VCLLAAALHAQDPLSGNWMFVLDTEGGERRIEATLKVEDGAVAGKWGGADVKGTFAEAKLNLAFSFTSDEAGFTDTMKIEGGLENGSLTGKWTFGQYAGTFVAKRKE